MRHADEDQWLPVGALVLTARGFPSPATQRAAAREPAPTEACGVPNGTHNQAGHTLHITARIERGQVLGGLISEYRSPA